MGPVFSYVVTYKMLNRYWRRIAYRADEASKPNARCRKNRKNFKYPDWPEINFPLEQIRDKIKAKVADADP